MSFDPYAPYGPLVDTTLRIASWNVWGRFGDGEQRQQGIEAELAAAAPDVVALVESWATADDTQAARVAARLGLAHHLFAGDRDEGGWTSGIGVVSRWPLSGLERHPLPGDDGAGVGEALFVRVEGPRGPVQLFVVMLDHPLDASALRQAQVRQLAAVVAGTTRRRHATVVCGDFNAGPDSDELRMLTGASTVARPGLVFYDAWEIGGDGTPGHTWSNRNALAVPALYPDRRIDHVLSAWPRAGGLGHPTRCTLLGVTASPDDPQLSDHYGVLADLRY